MDETSEQKEIRAVMPYTLPHPFLTIQPPPIIMEPGRIVLTPMPMPSIKDLTDELRRLQGQTFSLDFQPSETFLADMRRFFANIKQMFTVIADGLRPAIQALTQFAKNNPDLFPSVKRPHLSKQSRHYLMVKRREQARRMRHGRKRYA